MRLLFVLLLIFLNGTLAQAGLPAIQCEARKDNGEIERVALIVGNNKVLNGPDLANGINDARLIGRSLEQFGFEIVMLEDATGAEFKTALDEFKDRIGRLCPHDLVVFYYAGNGFEIGRMSYLATIDVREPTSLENEYDALRPWVRLSDVLESVRGHPGPKVILIDTCRNYGLKGSTAIANSDFAPDLKIPKNTLIGYAAEPGQYAIDGVEGHNNGPYAFAFSKWVGDRHRSIENILRSVRIDVDDMTHGIQIPFMESGLREEVFFDPEKPVESAPKPQTKGRRVALVIGNGSYLAKNVDRLDNPVNDATDVAAALKRIGFEVKELHDATQQEMRGAISEFDALIDVGEPADLAVVYFAGHGIARDESPYLVPIDAQLKSHTVIDQELVPVLSLIGTVAKARRLGLLIIDACRNNPFQKQLAQDAQKRKINIGTGLPAIEPGEDNVLVAYATKHGQTAWDGTAGARNSPFVQALLESLEQPGIDIEMIFRKVRDGVKKRTKNEQQPYTYASLPGVPVYLVAPKR